MRGEYLNPPLVFLQAAELPPRARRIHLAPSNAIAAMGTTSACAENTLQSLGRGDAAWNYLRVRGEYDGVGDDELRHRELPPRARRILAGVNQTRRNGGTTSACAENTS